jgi:1-acyl-sn-glycerol-3-phosphate acyltransferase
MLYQFLKIWVKGSFWLYARIKISGKEQINKQTKATLITANHPNSFLDALLIAVTMQQPVHFHTRSDVFKNSMVRKLFAMVNMMPVYRIRDGKEKLTLNQQTQLQSIAALEQQEAVLVFVEGFCANQTRLQVPLKKGAPRVVLQSWQQGHTTTILPIWLQYSSFTNYPKQITLAVGNALQQNHITETDAGAVINQLNLLTTNALLQLSQTVTLPVATKNILLHVLGWLGACLHVPLYLVVHFIAKILNTNVHYDSLFFVVGTLLYPLYVAVVLWAALLFYGSMAWLLLLMPLLLRCFILAKN